MSAVLKLKTLNGRPILRGYEHVWSVILQLTRSGDSFTRHDVDQACCDPNDTTVTDYLRRLLKAGYLAEIGTSPGRHRRKVYRLVKRRDEAPRLRRDGSAAPVPVNQLLWNTMRRLLRDGFNARELAAFASTCFFAIAGRTRIRTPSFQNTCVFMFSTCLRVQQLQ